MGEATFALLIFGVVEVDCEFKLVLRYG